MGGEEPTNKRIHLVHTTIEPTEKVEKEVEGFKLVALAKDPYAGVGKPINASVLDFQKRHFYSKNANRVDSGTFMSQKRIKSIRSWHCLFLIIPPKENCWNMADTASSCEEDTFPNESDVNTNMLQVSFGEYPHCNRCMDSPSSILFRIANS